MSSIAFNAVWATLLKTGGVAFTMLVNVFVARLLPIEEVGYYFLLTSLAFFGALIARFGMRQSIVKVISQSMALDKPATARGAARKFILLTIAGVFMTSTIYLLIGEWLQEQLFNSTQYPFICYVILWLAVLAIQSVLSDIFRGYQRISLSTLIDGALANVVIASGLILLILIGFQSDLEDIVAVTLGGYLLAIVFAAAKLMVSRDQSIEETQDDSRYTDILSLSYPIFIVNLCTYLMAEASLWYVAYFGTKEDVAIYGACVKLVKLVTLPLLIQNIVITPLIVQLHTTKENDRLRRLVRGAATITAVPSLLLIIIYMTGGAQILGLVFGTAFSEGWLLLSILSVGYLVNVCSGPCNNTLLMTGHERLVMKLFLLSTVIGVSVMMALGSNHGATGIAIGVSTALILHNLSAVFFVYKTERIKTYASLNQRDLAQILKHVSAKLI